MLYESYIITETDSGISSPELRLRLHMNLLFLVSTGIEREISKGS